MTAAGLQALAEHRWPGQVSVTIETDDTTRKVIGNSVAVALHSLLTTMTDISEREEILRVLNQQGQ